MRQVLKRFCVGAMTAVLAATSFPVAGFAKTGAASEGGGGSKVEVVQKGDALSIGNDQISRTFSLVDGKLSTATIENKRAKVTYTPAEGSEEFVFKTTKTADGTAPAGPAALPRDAWTATADSEEKTGEGAGNGLASCLIDGSLTTIWHTAYQSAPATDLPHWAQFDLGGEVSFASFSYTPRQNGEATNGNIKGYKLLYSDAAAAPADEADWTVAAEGELSYNGVNPIYVNLEESVTARHVRLVATSNMTGTQFAGGAEFNLHAEKAAVATDERSFAASDLKLAGKPKVEATTATINGVEKTGKKVTFVFEPFELKGVSYTVREHVVMYDGDHYLRKYLEISVPKAQAATAAIDYIDLESLKVSDKDSTWTVSTDAGGIVEMDRFKANLGQPIYIDGMFLGCEFPETDTQIAKNTGYMRYYSGKTFERLVTDAQAGESADGDAVVYSTWQTVAGAARSMDTSVIQQDFFDYIDDIATPTEFRTQYNSWFDNMMRIDDENILDSFTKVNEQLEAAGAAPLDSYVVDDGWNNYNDTRVVDAVRSGTTLNQTGFWEFNSKFPDGLFTSSSLVQKLGSNFGVWIGPRGGYNFYGSLADILTKSGKGSKAGGSIDVADRTYVKNFQDMAVKWQQDYGVNYWKWDGFADRAQYNAFSAADGVPGRANNHMTGGYQNMYHVTDLWEAWIDLFEAVRQSEVEDGIDNLWISLTCYVNPSAWWLQWANSVWIQCTADQANAGPASQNLMDRQLNYRDACYYDFIVNHEFQFPLANIYNHDPIYGKEGTGMSADTATDVQFANYLYAQASRGTSFWELYYSESLLSEGKWQVTAQFLKWAEENNHLLRNAKMFGASPNSQVTLSTMGNSNDAGGTYGFAGFDGDEGLIMVRNPSSSAKDVTFAFDATNGVAIDSGSYDVTLEHVYNPADESDAKATPSDSAARAAKTFEYGKSYTFNLQGNEAITFRVSKKADAVAPKIASVATDGAKTVTVKFDEFVSLADGAADGLSVEGAEVAGISASADRVTFDITLKEAPKAGTQLTVRAGAGVTDAAGNEASDTATVAYRKGNKVAGTAKAELAGTTKKLGTKAKSLSGAGSFSVDATVTTSSTGAVIAAQPEGYALGIDAEGRAYVTVNGVTATSDATVADGVEHRIVAERAGNGILKVYVDGALSGSAYAEASALFAIPAGQAVVGSAEFTGTAKVTVYDAAQGFAAISGGDASGDGKIDKGELTATAVGGTSEGSIASIFDGDATTFWTSAEKAGGIAKSDPAVEVDLGGKRTINKVVYTKRYANQANAYWDCTGNLLDYFLEYSDDGGKTWKDLSSGATTVSKGETANNEKGSTAIEFDAVDATNIRISGSASYHWQAANENKFMAVGELVIYEVEKPEAVDTAALEARIAELEKVGTDGKTAESVKAFKAAIAAAKAVLENAEATQDDVDAALDELDGAEDLLVDAKPDPEPEPKPDPDPEPGDKLDTSAAQEALEAAKKLAEDAYTAESWKAFAAARDALAKALDNPDGLTQEALDALVSELSKARESLVAAEDSKQEDPKTDPKPDAKDEAAAGRPSNKKGILPKTGDGSVLGVALAAGIGGALLCAGVALSARRKRG